MTEDRGYPLHTGPRVSRVGALTETQRAAMAPHAQWWIRRALDTTPADRPTVERGIVACYAAAGFPAPEIVWAADPYAAVAELVRRGVTDIPPHRAGHLQARWLAWVTYYRDACGLTLGDELDGHARALEAASSAGPWWVCDGLCVVTERCSVVEREQVGEPGWGSHRLHCTTGPALAWAGGTELYYLHGEEVPRHVVMDPASITRQEIDGCTNAEVRRIMIDRYGAARYAEEAGVLVSDEVDEVGQPLRLYRREVEGDEPIVFVRMVNSTTEPDGTRREFWRRVPPTTTSAIAARNWVCRIGPAARFAEQS